MINGRLILLFFHVCIYYDMKHIVTLESGLSLENAAEYCILGTSPRSCIFGHSDLEPLVRVVSRRKEKEIG